MPRIRLLRGLWFYGFKGGRSSYSKNRTILRPLLENDTSLFISKRLHAKSISTVSSLSPLQSPKTNQSSLLLKELQRTELPPPSEQLAVRNLVLKGGGPKGLAYVTALQELERQLGSLESVLRVAGSSAGSIVSSLLAVGYQPKELQALLQEEDAEGRPVMLSFALDGSQYEWIQHLNEGEALPKLSDDTIYLQVKGETCVAYWDEGGEIVSHSCSAKEIEPILKELPAGGEKSGEKTLLKQVKVVCGLAKADQAVIDAINRISLSVLPKVRAPAEVMSSLSLSAKLWRQGGVCRGVFFERWLNRKLSQKIIEQESEGITDPKQLAELEARYQTPTLRDLQNLINKQGRKGLFRYKHLYSVTAQQYQGYSRCCVYTSEEVIGRPDELTCFGQVKTVIEDSEASQQLSIAKVARASMSIPYFFTPVELIATKQPSKYSLREYLFTDGGVLDNYPINLFDSNVYHSVPDVSQLPSTPLPNPETLGFYLYDEADRSRVKELWRTCKLVVLSKVWPTLLASKIATVKEDHSQLPRTIKLDTCGVTVFDFTMPIKKQAELLSAGTAGTREFFAGAPHAAGHLKQKNDKLVTHHQDQWQTHYAAYKRLSNVDTWSISDNYVEHPQYQALIDSIRVRQNPHQVTLTLSGLGGSGKSELAKYLGRRYLEAHFWSAWRSGHDMAHCRPPLVWFWSAENAELLWASCQALALWLGVARDDLPKLERDPLIQKDERSWKQQIEQAVAALLSTIKQRYPSSSLCYVFDNAQILRSSSDYPGLHFYLSQLSSDSSWLIVTSRDSSLLPAIFNPLKQDLDEGLGLRVGMNLLTRYLPQGNPPREVAQLTQSLYTMPLSLILAAAYITERGWSVNRYLTLLHQKKQDQLEEGLSHVARDSLYDKQMTQQGTIQLSLEQLQSEKNGQAAMSLLQFCSRLHADEIPRVLLLTFVSRLNPNWSEDLVEASLDAQLKLLGRYSLVKANWEKPKDTELTYHMHRLTQSVVAKSPLKKEEQAMVEALLYCAKNDQGQFLIYPQWVIHYAEVLKSCTAITKELQTSLLHYAFAVGITKP